MQLPPDLRTAIDQELEGIPVRELAAVAAELSQRYRSGAAFPGGLARSRREVAAYAAFRLPATYAAAFAALDQVKAGLPQWQPRSLLDAGAGPGTAMWAAAQHFPTLQEATLLEREAEMIALGERLAAHGRHPLMGAAKWVRTDIAAAWRLPAHDLVIASYVLGELGETERELVLRRLWEHAAGALLLIEPGTPAGFARILAARAWLLEAGAHLVAPCPHAAACPLTGGDWCHFAQRVARSRLHRDIKDGELSYEDEKFSLICAARMPAAALPGRILRRPQTHKGRVRFAVCTAGGTVEQRQVTRAERERYRAARDLRWGSPFPWP